ncbi:MAG: anaerobic sulfatase maturase [Deltaproteobacteria bacterium]|nr:MAG: anaerobic sulfatase maturase [Deltaproteobacteria bacterium]
MSCIRQHTSNPFSLLVKPASSDCNLSCDYCFYLEKHKLYPETIRHRMKDEVLEKMISSYMNTSQPVYYFAWQGGEPTLMGPEFFQKVVEFQTKYGWRGAIVSNGLQTNATRITDSLAVLLSKYKFLVGVSIDGPEEIHNRYRANNKGRGSHGDVLRGIEILKRHGVEFNALTLVSASNVDHAKTVYRYLYDLGIYHHQYIPGVEFDGTGKARPFSISGKQWGNFLCGIFDEWIPSDTRRVSVRLFDSIVGHMMDWRYRMCLQAGRCNQYFVVEYNGDIYPCDFFVGPQNKLGNILSNTWDELGSSKNYRSFGKQKADWNNLCKNCDFLRFCSGDCLKHRHYKDKNSQTLSWLCEGWRKFYRHALPSLEKIAMSLLNERQPAFPHPESYHFHSLPRLEIRRNDPCFCGSGKKLKYCHGAGKVKTAGRKRRV